MGMLEILKPHNGEVHFRGVTFSSVADIHRQMDACQERMDDVTSKLKQLAMATPIGITPSGYTPIEYINEKVDDLTMEYFDLAQIWNVLSFASGIIHEYAIKENITMDEAFEKCYVDKYSDLRADLANKDS